MISDRRTVHKLMEGLSYMQPTFTLVYKGGKKSNLLIPFFPTSCYASAYKTSAILSSNMGMEDGLTNTGTAPLLGASNSSEIGDGSKRAQKHLQGWRMGATLSAIAAATILLLNIIVTIAASARNPEHGGLADIQDGNCAQSERIDFWLHLLINVLSTILLAASNYCMQCLSSPTRADIDKAHSQHRWLDIGIPSIRNLGSMSLFKLSLWWLLALSSIPLHLLYNSAVISTRASQEYDIYVGSPDLISGNVANWSMPVSTFFSYGYHTDDSAQYSEIYLDQFRNVSTWNKLDNDACIQAYYKTYIVGYGDVIAITSGLNATVPLLHARKVSTFDTSNFKTQDWMCSAYSNLACDINQLRAKASSWALNDTLNFSYDDLYSQQYPVEYCLSEPVDEQCKVQLSLVIVAVVIACNAIKLCCMLLVLWKQRSAPLVTLGDAIESFMLNKDTTTSGMCWANKKTFTNQQWEPSARPWLRQRHYWFASASIRRWVLCNICSITTIIVAGILLNMGLDELHNNQSTFRDSGFGAVNTNMMARWSFGGTSGILVTALIANIPQLLLSFLFLTYNGLYTCMLLADEWSGYAHERKPLRVTKPYKSQRSTYRLQLPYKYIIPLSTTSTILHWLVSRSLFLARVTLYTSNGQEDLGNSVSTIGYSCIPLSIVLALGSITVLAGLLNGCRRYKPGMPLAGSCSAAISAACHLPEEDINANEKPVLWGVVGMKEGGVGHCSFTSLEAEAPVEGESYAGLCGGSVERYERGGEREKRKRSQLVPL